MRLAVTLVTVVLVLQAATLFYSAHERHVFHQKIEVCKSQLTIDSTLMGGDPNVDCFEFDEKIRYVMVAFTIAAAYLLLVGEAAWPALLAQLGWILLQNDLCADQSLENIRNCFLQILIFCIIGSKSSCCKKEVNV